MTSSDNTRIADTNLVDPEANEGCKGLQDELESARSASRVDEWNAPWLLLIEGGKMVAGVAERPRPVPRD